MHDLHCKNASEIQCALAEREAELKETQKASILCAVKWKSFINDGMGTCELKAKRKPLFPWQRMG